MKKMSLLLLVLLLLTQTQAFASGFTDIQGHWAEADIKYSHEQGIMSGTGNVFCPDAQVSRAELAVYLVQVFGLNIDHLRFIKAPEPGDLYDDIGKEQWYSDAVMIAGYNSIFEVGDRKFKPEEKVTRIEVANSVARAFKAKKINLITTQIWPNYTDLGNINDSDIGVINFMFNSGIMIGRNTWDFAPNAHITRAEVAVILNNTVKVIAISNPHLQDE